MSAPVRREQLGGKLGTAGRRPVHVRAARPARRMTGKAGVRVAQVRALCGAWVARCEATRDDVPGAVTTITYFVTCLKCARLAVAS